ncbi:hypothetical protein [Streptomyces sp. NPDC056169]|uniref:hypothetical protein n=1 Tax=Streptomyces sp. NPDC056169 TaxID=3345734 RepID=UPI0035DFAED9
MTDFGSDLYEALINGYLAKPEADEAPYYTVSDSLRLYGDAIWNDAGDANQHIQRLLSSGRGEAMDALGQHWDKVMNQDVGSVVAVAGLSAAAVADIAATIAATKAELVQVASECATVTVAQLVSGALTFRAPENVVASSVANAQSVSQTLVATCHQRIAGTLKTLQQDPAVAGLQGVAADLAAGIGGAARDGAADAGTGRSWGTDLVTGPGRAVAEGVHVDHAEHERAAGRLREVATAVYGTTAGHLAKASADHATAAASGALGAAIAASLNTVLDDLTRATKAFGDHLNGALPDGILLISSSQQSTDDDNRKRVSQLD